MSNANKDPSMQEILTQIRTILTESEKKTSSSNPQPPASPRGLDKVKSRKPVATPAKEKAAKPPRMTASEKILAGMDEEVDEGATIHVSALERFEFKDEYAFDGGAGTLKSLAESQELISKTEFLKSVPGGDVIELTREMIYQAPSVIDEDVLEDLCDVMSKELSKSLMITYLQPKVKSWLRENLPFYLKDIKLKKN